MHKSLLTSLFLATALTGAAFAQSSQSGSGQAPKPNEAQQQQAANQSGGSQTGQQSSGQRPDGQQPAEARVLSQDQLKAGLENAGFSEIQIIDAAYLVSAKSPGDEMVVMLIDPANMTQRMNGQMQGGQSTGQSESGQSSK